MEYKNIHIMSIIVKFHNGEIRKRLLKRLLSGIIIENKIVKHCLKLYSQEVVSGKVRTESCLVAANSIKKIIIWQLLAI